MTAGSRDRQGLFRLLNFDKPSGFHAPEIFSHMALQDLLRIQHVGSAGITDEDNPVPKCSSPHAMPLDGYEGAIRERIPGDKWHGS